MRLVAATCENAILRKFVTKTRQVQWNTHQGCRHNDYNIIFHHSSAVFPYSWKKMMYCIFFLLLMTTIAVLGKFDNEIDSNQCLVTLLDSWDIKPPVCQLRAIGILTCQRDFESCIRQAKCLYLVHIISREIKTSTLRDCHKHTTSTKMKQRTV